jgi:hypothetical protein
MESLALTLMSRHVSIPTILASLRIGVLTPWPCCDRRRRKHDNAFSHPPILSCRERCDTTLQWIGDSSLDDMVPASNTGSSLCPLLVLSAVLLAGAARRNVVADPGFHIRGVNRGTLAGAPKRFNCSLTTGNVLNLYAR